MWRTICAFSLVIILVMGRIGIIWAVQTITNLETKLVTARKAIIASNRNLRKIQETRLNLETKLQSTQQALETIRQKLSESSQKIEKQVTEQHTPLPSYNDNAEEENPQNTFIPGKNYNHTSSFTDFRGKCTSC